MTVLPPDSFDPGHLCICFASGFERMFEMFLVWRNRDENDVDVFRAKRLFPILGTALAHIAEFVRS